MEKDLSIKTATLIAQQSSVFKSLRVWEQEQAIQYIYMSMLEADNNSDMGDIEPV
ncbi:MAG: hypothetical protein HY755_10670 [Nitrospirae bacterium]|nr:hypothetical protein [Nitrospirota bacterium]